jgi:hypothetical protein
MDDEFVNEGGFIQAAQIAFFSKRLWMSSIHDCMYSHRQNTEFPLEMFTVRGLSAQS